MSSYLENCQRQYFSLKFCGKIKIYKLLCDKIVSCLQSGFSGNKLISFSVMKTLGLKQGQNSADPTKSHNKSLNPGIMMPLLNFNNFKLMKMF